MDKKYQCPKHCAVNHNHKVYFNSETGGIIINEEETLLVTDIIEFNEFGKIKFVRAYKG